MFSSDKVAELLKRGFYSESFMKIYSENQIEKQILRYIKAISEFEKIFGKKENIRLFSAPGRTELGGNHTDHNYGRVIAASINLDVIAVVSKNSGNVIRIKSEGHEMDIIELNDLQPKEIERNHSSSLIRGISAMFKENGKTIGGFDAYTTSDVLKGSGLSSSAAFEVLTGTILRSLYNNVTVSPVDIAKYSQYAENTYFGKPCGLMDQMASSVGGIVAIDFMDVKDPVVEEVDFDFDKTGYYICVVDTSGNHSDLTDEYAAIFNEMAEIAESFGKERLREPAGEVSLNDIIDSMDVLRSKYGDRAVLRAIHFIKENKRAALMADSLQNNNFEEFLNLTLESGHSSFEYLQNIFTTKNVKEQGVSIALCLAQEILQGKGAWRVHGGGFAGTTLNYVPESSLGEFEKIMTGVFGEGSCHVLKIRKYGGIEVIENREGGWD